MKASEIRKMTPEERLLKLNELRVELVKLRLQSRVGTLTNTARIRNVRRDIARILTVMREESIRERERVEEAKEGLAVEEEKQ
ncbi:LSU ribosomal protein L29P [Thermosphaera aggregans DSM 11486]|uniref:Large ribosomal subunit protein uL29 n=1 Tax=Thermosphaera aggregans (strain DSM 11486 / M11TL) TaxID=633148 RepID=D5U1X7_THEAM|nr:50S ribosomal protein L29 [Thermosphaera aggregans]ADG91127.1 LSU ribosomal protein L29P [Thermosphaera aggregans DSM 11486]